MPSGDTTCSDASAASLDLSAIPRDSASRAKMEERQALARYELGNSLLLAAGRPDSAATWYRRVLQESGDHPVATRALYALAEAHRIQGDTLAARGAYRRLIEQHPETSLAQRARRRLGRAPVRSQDDRSAQADSLYAGAYEQWQGERHRPALEQFLTVAERYPDTGAAPRALLASAVLYWKQVQADTASGTGTIMESRALMDRYLKAKAAGGSTAADPSRAGGQSAAPAATDTLQQTGPQPPRAPIDSTGASPSSAAGPETSVQDSVGQNPAAQVPAGADSAGTSVRPDSVQSAPERMTADSTGGGGGADPLAPLTALLRHLTEQYPDAPQVSRAKTLQTMIEEKTTGGDEAAAPETTDAAAPSPDSAATGAERSTPPTPAPTAPDSARADSPERSPSPQRPDSTAQPSDSENRTPLPAPTGP